MSRVVPRRVFLQGSIAAAVAAWSPVAKSWVSCPGPGTIAIPGLDGQLLFDSATLAEAADDFGHIVHHTPLAVLEPGSVDDIVKVVDFARAHCLKVSAGRGLGDDESHSTQGQSQVQGGIFIDMSALATIHEINAGDALVDAGVHWSALLAETVPLGKSPPTLTDYIELSVGGTMSGGGIGGQTFQHGLQIDNVLELTVVTGRGELVTCSPSVRPDLFTAVRAGLGQFAIIVRARVRLIDVPPMVRLYNFNYTDLTTYTNDQLFLIDSGRFDFVEGTMAQGTAPAPPWTYTIQVGKYFDPASPPNDAALLAGLHYLPGTETQSDLGYFDFANQLAPLIELLVEIGLWAWPHPWLDLFIPASETVSFVQSALALLTPENTGGGPIALYPIHRNRILAPFFPLPDAPISFLFSVLRFADPTAPGLVSACIAQNSAFYDACRALGGKRYAIDSVPMTHADWALQLAPHFADFALAKVAFDPDNVLTPGQGIF